jgi:large subunit ribosomal protein L25
VDAKAMRELLHGGHNVVVRLSVEDGGEDSPTVMMREIQRHPLTGALLNVDFQRISLTEKVQAQVSVTLVGEAPGLKQGGVLDHVLREVEVEALPTDLSERIELDVSHLRVGESLHVSDLVAPAGVAILADATDVVVSMFVPRAVEEVAPVAAEVPEGEEAPAEAEGEAAEAGEESEES